jgi:hypothetical protein
MKMDDFVLSSEDELIDLTREYENYIRKDSFFDQLNRGNKLVFIALILLAFSIMHIVSSFVGLI